MPEKLLTRKRYNMSDLSVIDVLENKIMKSVDVDTFMNLKFLDKRFRNSNVESEAFDYKDEIVKSCKEGNVKKAKYLFNLCSKKKKFDHVFF